ncbi:apolipoprotein N-acyltransferase [Actinoalloteichus hymeniacidonis]|uniref:Apolipoprotein N-acyltransferase n=1 Tax=Actinoalloteichus hymeniacidonis TaxID=340345 RepID=A0AAC9HQJ9_9PSEU|nr:apolipoprotein N-acyltransferase [Actinoalloteichus hymeniacidonis]AOS63595.1 apolipoprotein N-acyltransferase [Actinoalloteichus hymeniacidonis]MBB5908358.1 apolipoprotein N-acyltransferase [Actinoalloteichus hymeniacidonis]
MSSAIIAASPSGPAGPDQQATPNRRHTLLRVLAALASGGLLSLTFAPFSWWWLAPIALALFASAVHRRRARGAFGLGFVAGMAFFLPLLTWTNEYVGAVPWIILAALEALFFGVAAILIALVSRLPLAPLWAAGGWVAAETVRGAIPFGGFPLGSVGFGQADGLFLSLASIGGVALVGFAVALCGFGLAELARRVLTGRRNPATDTATPRSWLQPAALILVPVLVALVVLPTVGSDAEEGTVTAAVIQGNVPQLGLEFNAQRRAVLDNHAAQTRELADEVAAGDVAQPDIVIWPENASDIDPFRNADAAAVIESAVRAIDAPTMVGTLETPAQGDIHNTVVHWEAGEGPVDTYRKREIQPFGERMPLRGLVSAVMSVVNPSISIPDREYQPGDTPGVFAMGDARVGVVTCWEVAFDHRVNDTVRAGATVLSVPSNNAAFGLTPMSEQQLAISQLRAVEHGRAVLVAATSGISAVVSPAGDIISSSELFTADALVEEIPLRSTTTLATRLGSGPEWMLSALGLVAAGWVVIAGVRRRRHDREPVTQGEIQKS